MHSLIQGRSITTDSAMDITKEGVVDNAIEGMSDEAVIEQICLGHDQAYEIIMRRYNQRLFRASRSILQDNDVAQDAMQEAYIKAFYKLDSYVPNGSFAAWLTRIVVNEALMIKRKPDNRVRNNVDNTNISRIDTESLNAPRADPADALANNELAGLIEVAIDALPDSFRSVFVLRAVQQLTVGETASSLDIPKATVKTRFYRARNLIQEALNEHIQEAGLDAYEFAGKRCDRIVQVVFSRLKIGED